MPSRRKLSDKARRLRRSSALSHLKLTLAYDGTPFVGWQRQKNGVSVQQKIEEALERIGGRRIVVHGASRTDTGVHATGMIAHCERPVARLTPAELLRSLNALLPEEIRVLRIQAVPSRFHARFDARSKWYRYRILNARIADPFRRGVTWFVHKPLNVEAMRKAARFFVGRHDFSAVAVNPGYERTSMVRRIDRCRVVRRKDEIHIDIEADGFLYKMVRTIVGTLVEVGSGKRSPESIRELLASRDRNLAGKTAPAQGLCLIRVNYR